MHTEYSEKYRLLGVKISYYRRKAGYPQDALAKKTGKSTNFLVQVDMVKFSYSLSTYAMSTLFMVKRKT